MVKRIQSKKSRKSVENRTFLSQECTARNAEKMKIPQWEPHNLINTRLQPGDHGAGDIQETVLTVSARDTVRDSSR